jgi:hypothetical protein
MCKIKQIFKRIGISYCFWGLIIFSLFVIEKILSLNFL